MKKTTSLLLIIPAVLACFSACGSAETIETTQNQTAPPAVSVFTPPETTTVFSTTPETSSETEQTETTSEHIHYIQVLQPLNRVMSEEELPEGFSFPSHFSSEEIYADVLFQVSDYEFFTAYAEPSTSGTRLTAICYTNNSGFLWDIMPRYCGKVIDLFAIDRQNFIILSSRNNVGYDIYICKNGVDLELFAASAWHVDYENDSVLTHEYILPRSEFATGTTMPNDMAFYEAVTSFRLEPIDDSSCRIVLEYVLNGEERTCTAIYDANGIRPE